VKQQPGSSFFAKGAETIAETIDREMSNILGTSRFTPQENLALACRLLADEGHARTLAGQITMRADQRETLWTTSFGVGFAETSAGNLLRVDDEMQTVEGSGMPNPAVRFHLWIYRARPELNCIVHTHPPHCSALSMIGETLAVSHMDAMMFHEDCAWLENWPGVPVSNEEGRLICEALGQKRSILLAHHGMLTTGKTLEEAVYLAVLLEHAAQLHLSARSAGEIRPVQPHLARQAHDFLLKDAMIGATFDYWTRRTVRQHPDALNR
jgi:L-fuculose-phosphate aldolase